MVKLDSSFTDCRMYKKAFPSTNDLVYTQIVSVDEIGAYCALLEYNNIEGMIVYTEASRFRVPNIRKVLRKGRQIVCAVLRVDEGKKFIDLSKRRVSPDEAKEVEQRFAASKIFHSAMTDLALKTNTELKTIYENFGWRFYDIFDHALDGLKLLAKNRKAFEELYFPSVIKSDKGNNGKESENFNLSSNNSIEQTKNLNDLKIGSEDSVTKKLETYITEAEKIAKRRLGNVNLFKARAEFNCYCFTENGVKAIVEGFGKVKEKFDDKNIEVKYLAAPKYILHYKNEDKEKSLFVSKEFLSELEKEVRERGGFFSVVEEPSIVNWKEDEKKINALIRECEEEEREVDGDDL